MTAKTVTRPRPLTDEDIETLDTLALRHKPGCDVPFIAGVLACRRFSPQELQAAWEAFQDAVIWRQMLSTDQRRWCEYRSESALPAAPTLQEAAIQLACAEADEARSHFVFGGPK
ncbi:MAG TPA: hypothetical protein VMU94_18195 [Streptosporangiaceae bacterium]|nr:hypothetical protein [Streptosporangiaceae bacterium]